MTFDELLQDYNIPVAPENHEHSRAGWIQFDCPFCSPGWDHYRMGFNTRGRYVNCWACGKHGLIETVAALTELSYSRCQKLLDEVESVSIVAHTKKRGKLVLPAHVGKLKTCHCNYLKERGFDVKQLQRIWNIQGIGLCARLQWRIFIPIYLADEVVSWTTRSISDNHSHRYISAEPKQEIFPHKDLLYGEEYAHHAIVIVEGPTDVWRIGPGAVATLGTSLRQSQILRMSKYMVRVVCFDNERTAQKRARRLCDELSVFTGETVNVKLDAKDPGSATENEIWKLRRTFLNHQQGD